ncbi:Bug family tripartite tricarboxylate transporter substrate binding protein [Comamonas sp. NoAH]|uniref:Bug family tripartite tricarboxylate transporter substrate binding protein n=1 Tax=Comamonas halotolerans TaxID=3041496 RepID=UPI0024E137F4|nr:tripartite tricarboxylate transporter substrate-binding protein [Comamonas sp. NoAH]
MISRRLFLATSAATALWPLKDALAIKQTVRLVVGFDAGGPSDFVAQLLAQNLAKELNVPVIVENRPGADGRIAVDLVKKAKPDGRTLLVTASAMLAVYPHIYSNLTYDPVVDLAPVASLCTLPYCISVGNGVPDSVRTLQEFCEWLKHKPAAAVYGTPGACTPPHFLGAMFAQGCGAKYSHVPYRAGLSAVQDAMEGQISSSFNLVCDSVPFVHSGKLRALAVSSAQRIPLLPEVPTFAEQGRSDLTSEEWFGLFAPVGTDPAWIQTLYKASRKIFNTGPVQKQLYEMACSPAVSTPKELAITLRKDIARWVPVVARTGLKVEA